jgi:hypothetical protein
VSRLRLGGGPDPRAGRRRPERLRQGGVSIGLFQPTPKEVREQRHKLHPADPAGVQRYLEGKFKDALPDAYEAIVAR